MRPPEPPSRRDSSASAPSLARFELRDLLGRGGMGTVWRALELETGREVALKLLATRHGDEERRARFRREAELTARLAHPGIVRVLSVGESGDGRPWIAYELVEGARTLRAALPGLDRRRRVELVRDAARALAHAHARGVVHRDVKLENLLLDGSGRLRVADFGLAQAADLERLTRSGALVGTPGHMAPEQLRGEPPAPTADVWALGALLYELLGDESPFAAPTLPETVARVEAAAPVALRRLDRTIPPELEAVCARALARDPAARFPEAGALAGALEAWLQGRRGGAPGWGRLLPRGRTLLLGLGLLGPLLLLLPAGGEAEPDRGEAQELLRAARELLQADRLLEPEAARLAELRQRARQLHATATAARRPLEPTLRQAEAELGALQGLLHAGAGRFPAARRQLAELEAEPLRVGASHLALRGVLRLDEDPARAAEDLAAARAQGVGLVEVRLAEGLARLRAGGLEREPAEAALRDLDRAVMRRGGRRGPDELELLVGALLALDRVELAERALAGLEAAPVQLTWPIVLARARRAIEADEPGRALELLRAALPPDPRPAGGQEERLARDALAQAELRLAALPGGSLEPPELDRALRLLGVAHLLRPELRPGERWAQPLVERGLSWLGGKRLDGPQLLALADLFASDPHVQEVVALHGGRMSREAKQHLLPVFRRAHQLATEPERREVLGVNLARALLHVDRLEECIRECERLAREPWSPDARALLLALRAEAWGRRGVWDAALEDLQRARAVDPSLPGREPLLWARVLRGAGRVEEAWASALGGLEGELSSDAVDSSGRDEAIVLVWELGRRLEGQRLAPVLERFLERHASWGGWWVRLALVRLELGQPEPARQALLRAAAAAERRVDPRLGPTAEEWRALAEQVAARGPEALPALRALVEALDRLRGKAALP